MIPNGIYRSNPTYDRQFEWYGYPTGRLEARDEDELFTIEYVEKNDPERDYYKVTFKRGVITGRIGKDCDMSKRVIMVKESEPEEEVI